LIQTSPEENHVGFIAEDVPGLLATTDRKGLRSMDIVTVLTKVVQEQQGIIQKQQKSIQAQQEIAKQQQEAISLLMSEIARLKTRDMIAQR
jgi:hypothetical protein